MSVVPNWKRVVKKAWSVRLAILCGIFSGAEVILPMFADSVPRGLFAGLSILAATGATVSRVVVQKELHDD